MLHDIPLTQKAYDGESKNTFKKTLTARWNWSNKSAHLFQLKDQQQTGKNPTVSNIITNAEVLAINQQPIGSPPIILQALPHLKQVLKQLFHI